MFKEQKELRNQINLEEKIFKGNKNEPSEKFKQFVIVGLEEEKVASGSKR